MADIAELVVKVEVKKVRRKLYGISLGPLFIGLWWEMRDTEA